MPIGRDNSVKDVRAVGNQIAVRTEFQFLHAIGFEQVTYENSTRFVRRAGSLRDEISVRNDGDAKYKVEVTKIKKLANSQRVKSLSIEGNLTSCVAYVKGLYGNQTSGVFSSETR